MFLYYQEKYRNKPTARFRRALAPLRGASHSAGNSATVDGSRNFAGTPRYPRSAPLRQANKSPAAGRSYFIRSIIK